MIPVGFASSAGAGTEYVTLIPVGFASSAGAGTEYVTLIPVGTLSFGRNLTVIGRFCSDTRSPLTASTDTRANTALSGYGCSSRRKVISVPVPAGTGGSTSMAAWLASSASCLTR